MNIPAISQMNIKDKIKAMKKEIERLKKLPDYEYVILDIQEEIKRKKLDQYKKAIDEEDWYTIEKIQKEHKKEGVK